MRSHAARSSEIPFLGSRRANEQDEFGDFRGRNGVWGGTFANRGHFLEGPDLCVAGNAVALIGNTGAGRSEGYAIKCPEEVADVVASGRCCGVSKKRHPAPNLIEGIPVVYCKENREGLGSTPEQAHKPDERGVDGEKRPCPNVGGLVQLDDLESGLNSSRQVRNTPNRLTSNPVDSLASKE